jgi:hypothetical protein
MPPKGDSARDELPSVGLESVGCVGEGECGEAFCERKREEMEIYRNSFQPCLLRDFQEGAMFCLRFS